MEELTVHRETTQESVMMLTERLAQDAVGVQPRAPHRPAVCGAGTVLQMRRWIPPHSFCNDYGEEDDFKSKVSLLF